MTILKKTLILLAVSLAFSACTTEPENKNAKPGEAITATPAPSATQAPTATPSPTTTAPAPASSPAKPDGKDNEK
jgi:starvation-inducible outer membrane lipoprotein